MLQSVESVSDLNCPLTIELPVCGKAINFEVDSGSSCSIIPVEIFKQNFPPDTKLSKFSKVL